MKYSPAFLIAIAVTSMPLNAVAQVYDNGAPNGIGGWSIYDDWRASDDFSLDVTTTFDLVTFWALLPTLPEQSPYSTNIFWEIFADDGLGFPGSSLQSGLANASGSGQTDIGFGLDSWQLDFSLGSELTLGPGIYWLALHDGMPGEITSSSLIWQTTSQGGGSQATEELFGVWGQTGEELAFQLNRTPTEVVPEPVTVILLGSGLAGLAAARRRGRKKHEKSQTR